MEGHPGSLFYYPLAILVGFFPWSVFAGPTLLDTISKFRSRHPQSAVYLFLVCWVGMRSRGQGVVEECFVEACRGVPWIGGAWKVFSETAVGSSYLAYAGELNLAFGAGWVALALTMEPQWGVLAIAGEILEYFRSSFESLLFTAQSSSQYSCETARLHQEHPEIPGILRDALATASVVLEDVVGIIRVSTKDWEATREAFTFSVGVVGFFRVLFYAVSAST